MEQHDQDDGLRESRTPLSSNQRASKEEETSVSDQALSNLRELGDSTGAMDSILAELRTLTLSTPFEQTGMAALEKFRPHFTGVAPETKLRDILPFRAKFCVKATALLLEWILRNVSGESSSSISDEALCVVARLIASPYVNFDHVELHDMLDANTELIIRLTGATRPSARLLSEITSAVRGSRDPSSLTKRRLLAKVSLQLLQRVAGSDPKVSTTALCSALLESGIGRGDSSFEHFAEYIVRGLAVEGSDANLSRALTWLDCVPEWLIALSVDRGIPVVIEWLLSAQANGSGSTCSSLLFHRCTLSIKAFLAIPTASQWMQKWLPRAISPDASDAGRAAALSLAVVTFRERASAEVLEQFCNSLSAGGFLKLVQNTLLQLNLAPARKQPCPRVCIVASDDQSDEGEPSSLEDDEDAEDLPALRSPDPTSSFAVAIPSLELAALNPQARSQAGPQSSSLSRTREDLLDRFDGMLELVRGHNVTESVPDARPSANSTSFADQFADLSSDEEASDNESEMVSETSGEQETVVRFRQCGEPKTLRAVSFQRYLGRPVHVADVPPSKLEWTITGSHPGMVLVGASEECLREKAEQIVLENFAEFHMGDFMWELVARSVGDCEASKIRTLALLKKAEDQINEVPSKRLHHMVYILAMDCWSVGYGESLCAVLKHFFKTVWTPPEVSWDWNLDHRARLAHHKPYEIEAETSTGEALRAFVKRVSHRELSVLTGSTENASLLQLGVSNGCKSTSLPFCELPTSREAQLGWLARFVSDHAQLRREKKEREAQAHLAALQGLVTGQSTAPGIRLGALVIMHGLVTSVNAPLYSSLDVGLTDALVRLAQGGQDEEQRSPIVLASVSLLERIARCRRKNERILGDEQHLAMCSMSQMPSNLWFYGTCSALLWNTVQSPAQATAVSQSVCWGRFLESMPRVPAWPRARALEAAVLHDAGMKSLVQQMDKNSASILAAIASTGSAKFARLLAQEANAKGAELALLAWSPTFGTETRANLLSALSPQIDRVPGLGLNLVVASTAAQRVNREFVRSHIAILVAALEQAIGDEECGLESPFYAAAAKALLPLAVSELHSDSSLETVQALLGILEAHTKDKKCLRTLDLSSGGICGADLVCLESIVGTRGFEEFDLSHNPSIGDDGATTVASWLAKPECNIRKLHMAGCGLGVRGFKRLADALRCPGHLTDLDLAGNAITEDGRDITGVLALAESLIWNTTLQQLDLSSVVLTQEGLTTLTRALRYNGALSCLRLEDTGASPLQLGAVYEKLASNRSGVTSSPHLGRGSLKKLPRLAREKARQTARILSGPNLAHLPYERSKGSGAKPHSSKSDVKTESLLEAFVRDTVRLENVNSRTEDSTKVAQEEMWGSTATELSAIMQRIQDLKARQDALFVGTQTHK